MTDTDVLHLGAQTMLVAGKLTAPIVLTALFVGLAISLFQSVTQIQEVTLTFVPKLLGCGLAILVCGHWMLTTLREFTVQLFAQLPHLLGSG